MEEDRQRLLHFLLKYEIYIVIMSRPFIITEYGRWIVGPDVTMDRYDASVGISSEEEGLTTPPRSGWDYRDGNSGDDRDWAFDDTLLFLPGGPKEKFV